MALPHIPNFNFRKRCTCALRALTALICFVQLINATPVIASEFASIIPNPASMTPLQGEFKVTSATSIVVPANDKEAMRVAQYFSDLVQRTSNLRLTVRAGAPADGAINFVRAQLPDANNESYQLDANPARVTISARTTNGLFYGGVTLWQLLGGERGANSRTVNAVKITDAPRFQWRGVMLDSARHFQSPEFIRNYIDWMALHKLNILHWHLTDDQAWRLEIKKYPLLTSVAGYRVPAGPAAKADIDAATGKPRQYGGFYSQQTVREIVAYAAERGITIMPEIEMPGHATATLVAYPKLGAAAKPPTAVPADWGIYDNVYNIEESTFTFLEDVLTEVMAMFPSKYIHIGGDEVITKQWKESAQVEDRRWTLGIVEPAAAHMYFTQRMGRFLQKNGRSLVGWDEILEPGLPPKSIVMSWRGVDGALKAAQRGFDTILSPWPTLYLDNRQTAAPDDLPGRVRVISVEDIYNFEPIAEKMTAEQKRHVLGLQGNVWTEHIRTENRVGAMTFPRAAAIAEVGWSSPAKRNWPDFAKRLAKQFAHYDALKIPYADTAFAVQANVRYTGTKANVELSTQAKFGDIHYTVDGSEPTIRSQRFHEPLNIALPAELRAATFADGQRLTRPKTIALRKEFAQRRSSQELKLCQSGIDLNLEDDAPTRENEGPRAVFSLDIGRPCWIFPQADLDSVADVTAAVGQVPFNFQIGDEIKKIKFATPTTPEGELEIRLDTCEGEMIARLPLKPAVASNAVTVLPKTAVAPRSGKHDLCIQFAQKFAPPETDLIWALDWINLTDRETAKP
jgi:hexosaminidase